MFEYTTRTGRRATINPRMITVILDSGEETCTVYTSDGDEPLILNESYEKVRNDFNNFMYTVTTVINM